MAVTIKLKNASGSDPSASDLVVGEVALRTDTAKLFTKKDDNSVAEIGATVGTDAVNTDAIQNDAVTFPKQQNIATSRVLGRVSSGSGNVEELTAANIRTLINVENGATADQSKSDIDALGIAASTAATLATARTIAGVSFDGSANISLNNNAITNGAGYITETLSNEEVQDIVGGMVSGNTETGITVTYQDSDGTLDFVVGTLNQDTTGNAATATALETARTIAGVSFDGTANISLNNNAITNGAGYLTSVGTSDIDNDAVTYAKIQNVSATNRLLGRDSSGAGNIEEIAPSAVRTMLGLASSATTDTTNASNISSGTLAAARVATLNQDTTGNAATATALETARTIGGTSFDGTGNITPAECTNADTVDSLHASSFVRSDAADVMSQGTQGTATLDVRNTGGAGSGTGTGALIAKFVGDSDAIEVRNIGGGDYGIYNSQQDNGFELYDGTGGVRILYNGTNALEFDSGNTYGDFKGVPTVNGTNLARVSDDITGNAATATKLATARTIAGVSFDGSANISLNNNAITNGAGYITSPDGGNAATLDSIDSSQFARSDTADTLSGLMTFTGGASFGADARCAAGVSTLSDGSTVTVNFTSGIHHALTIGGNRTLSHSNTANAVGQCGSIFITQDGTGSRTLSFNSAYKFVGGSAPSLSTSANAVDRIDYVVKSSSVIHCAISLDVK